MYEIPSNFCSSEDNSEMCICGKIEDMKHLYSCEVLNLEKIEVKFEKIYEDDVSEQIEVLERFEHNVNVKYNCKPCDP